MYISIKLPSEFGSFNQLQKENYPFNNLFTSYLAAVSRLGLNLKMDVDELVGYIEDRVFDGQRLPDVPEGMEPVNIRYKILVPEDAGDDCPGAVVQRYIEGSRLTNRMAVMYIARMTLRLSAAYGTSLLRLTRLIQDLDTKPVKKQKTTQPKQEVVTPKPRSEVKSAPVEEEPEQMPTLRVSSKASETKSEPVQETPTSSTSTDAAEAARAAVSALAGLTAQVSESEPSDDTPIVETNPFLGDFM